MTTANPALPRTAALAAEIRRRLGPPPALSHWPLVSIVVLNRDGAEHLRRLLAGLIEHTDYPHLELILVDNASSDDSLEYVRSVRVPFPISTIANQRNESFSDGCNQGAERADGELLLFLNNDTEPFEGGWLRELVSCLRRSNAVAAAATLICPEREHQASFSYGYGVAHRGLDFRPEDDGERGGWAPALCGWEADPLDEHLGHDAEPPAVSAACLLVDSGAFAGVGGFTHGFVYGCEDVDLSLKLRRDGGRVLCSGRSLLIHHPVSTRRKLPFERAREMKRANLRLLRQRWGEDLSGPGEW